LEKRQGSLTHAPHHCPVKIVGRLGARGNPAPTNRRK
jgi:hypothetical protein